VPEVLEKEVTQVTADVTLTTTTENVCASASVRIPTHNARVLVKGRGLLTTGADTTAVVPRIRDGAAITGTLRSPEDEQPVKMAAGGTEPFEVLAIVAVQNVDQYTACFTLDQVGATADGTVLHSSIEMEVLGG
jgi:hypothetical protein